MYFYFLGNWGSIKYYYTYLGIYIFPKICMYSPKQTINGSLKNTKLLSLPCRPSIIGTLTCI